MGNLAILQNIIVLMPKIEDAGQRASIKRNPNAGGSHDKGKGSTCVGDDIPWTIGSTMVLAYAIEYLREC